jgi:UPF0755 protein
VLLSYGFIVDEGKAHRECSPDGDRFVVSGGDSLRMIGRKLKEQNLVSDSTVFVLYTMIKGKEGALQAGTYVFRGECSVAAILDVLVSGRAVTSDIAITFPEGLRLDEVGQLFANNDIAMDVASFKVGDFVSQGVLSAAPATASLEGYLFPETYRFDPKKEDAKAMLQKMISQFEAEIGGSVFSEIQKSGRSLHEVIIIASLIEKEVRSDKDRALVSGIIHKRLSLSMPLQIDATVAYIVKKKTTKLTADDIAVDSPYNTYEHKGLPAGPIASPGISSIRAAVYPEASEYLYYLSKPDGETVFSRTLEEHIRAKNKYLR